MSTAPAATPLMSFFGLNRHALDAARTVGVPMYTKSDVFGLLTCGCFEGGVFFRGEGVFQVEGWGPTRRVGAPLQTQKPSAPPVCLHPTTRLVAVRVLGHDRHPRVALRQVVAHLVAVGREGVYLG